MGSITNRFCIYSSTDVATYERTAQRPDCAQHEHVSRDEAMGMVATILHCKTMSDGSTKTVYEFNVVRRVALDPLERKLQAIYFQDPRHWGIARSGGRYGIECHMMVKG